MADRDTLEAAAAAGLIAPEQVAPLRDFLSARASGASGSALTGEEDLRFIRNFHDLFLAIGIALFGIGLLVGVGAFAGIGAGGADGTAIFGIGCALAAGLMWLLGEVFARRRRLFVPAIAIVLSLTGFTVLAAATTYAALVARQDVTWSADFTGLPPEIRLGIVIALIAGVAAPAVFYARFKLPFSLGLTGAMAAFATIATAMTVDLEATAAMLPLLMLGLGSLLFFAGVGFDARDPERAARWSDNGFWLHFASAPLILNGVFGLVDRAFEGSSLYMNAGAAQAATTLAVVLLLGFLSLLINRRALIVSALLTMGVAIGIILKELGIGAGAGAIASSSLITLGAFVLILGAGWHSLRRALLGWVKPGGSWARVFPPEAPAAA